MRYNIRMEEKKYGRVVILGRPNTGKSTLLNAIMGQKVAITSPLPQTSRKNQRVLYRGKKGKIIFSDTPGIIDKVRDLVSKRANAEAPKELGRADVVVVMVDISRAKSEEENKVIGLVRNIDVAKILVYNKTDKAVGSKDHRADYHWMEEEFDKTVAVSAIKDRHVAGLLNEIFSLLPEKTNREVMEEIALIEKSGHPVMGMGSREYIAELIREKAYLCLRQEVPYSVNVEVIEIKEKKNIIVVKADIFTTYRRYKKMIIGRGGSKIKQIGVAARKELELMSGKKVFLELEVKIDQHWPERVMES